MLEWAIERFSPRISISTAFQTDGAVLLHMAYEIDPSIRVFSVDTGRLPQETFELIEQMRERYPSLQLDLLSPDAPAGERDGRQARAEPLLPQRREPPALLPGAQGAAAAAAPGRPRRLDHRACAATSGRPAATSARSRSTTTTARSSSSIHSPSGPRTRSGTTSASTSFRTTRCTTRASPRSAARRARVRRRRARTCAPAAGGGRRTRPRSAASTARSRRAGSSTSYAR